jgi:hypothetical protein
MFQSECDAWFKASQGKLSSKDNFDQSFDELNALHKVFQADLVALFKGLQKKFVALFNEFQEQLDFLPKYLKDDINA